MSFGLCAAANPSFDRLLQVQRVTKFLYCNVTRELIVFKLSHVRNYAIGFAETYTVYVKLECGPMPNVMAALLNIGDALCSTPQSLADVQYWSAVH